MLHKAKILIVGPPKSGKSSIANFLSDAADIASNDYRPTKGCRIVEFELPNIEVNRLRTSGEIELWDVSGDKSYSNCWPSIQRGTNGVILVYNADDDTHPRFLEDLHSSFVANLGLRDIQCIVLCHNKPGASGRTGKLSNVFNNIVQIDSDLSEEKSSRTRQDLVNFLVNVLSLVSEITEKHENYILQ